jgi:GT2 family glycosyltransferase
MNRPAVLAVILNWNGADHTLTCVQHLLNQSGADADILIVDNGSTDDSVERIRTSRLPVRLTQLDTNKGFAGGMNVGLETARNESYEYVWLVNNDAFASPTCLAELMRRMVRDPSSVMLSPRLLERDGTEQHCGGVIDWYSGDSAFLASADLARPLADGQWLTGTAPLIRTAILCRSGLLEPVFFAYWEDIDLCVRIQRTGGTVAAVPEAVATHIGRASSDGISPTVEFLSVRNGWLFLERNARIGSNRVRWLRFVSRSIERAAQHDVHGRPALARAALAGISAARRRHYGPPDLAAGPGVFERLSYVRPWGWSRLLARIADKVEPKGAARLTPTGLR